MNVVDRVAANDCCIGCGVCAGICPSRLLKMEWSLHGELVPSHTGTCPVGCGLCLDVCIFNPQRTKKPYEFNLSSAIAPFGDDVAGSYLSCYCGYSARKGQRESGASGGMATWFLGTLLEKSIIDRVALVGKGGASDALFSYRFAETVEQVRECSGSAYYPVELSNVLQGIARDEADLRYAVMALPCAISAIRRAMGIFPILRKRIVVLASLTCGQLQNRFYSEFVAVESGISLESLKTIDYRRKSERRSSSDFAHVAISHDGVEGRPLYYQDIPLHLWKYRYFTHNACNYCDDIFGETADVTFMDAWLPEYENEWRGTSLVIARSLLAQELLNEAMVSAQCMLKPVDIETVKRSQAGVVFRKTKLLAARLYAAEIQGKQRPGSRVLPSETLYRRYAGLLHLTDDIRVASKKLWPEYRREADTRGFTAAMKPLERRVIWYERFEKIRHLFAPVLKGVLSWR